MSTATRTSHTLCLSLLFFLLLVLCCTYFVMAEPVKTKYTEIELAAETTSIKPGEPSWLGLYFKLAPGWHTYWKNPGDSGQTLSLQWKLPPGISVGASEWPTPHRIPLGTFVNFGYENEMLLMFPVTTKQEIEAKQEVSFSAKVHWLVCKDICISEQAQVSLSLPVNKSPAALPPHPYWREVFSAARLEQPGTLAGWELRAESNKEFTTLFLKPKFAYSGNLEGLFFFPEQEGLIENAHSQTLIFTQDQYQLTIKNSSAPLKTLQGILQAPRGWGGTNNKKAVLINLPVKTGSKNNKGTPPT